MEARLLPPHPGLDAEVSIRDARLSDAEAVARLGSRAFPLVYDGLLERAVIDAVLAQTYSLEAVEGCIRDGAAGGHFLVGERDGKVVGFLDFDHRGGEPELHRIYVDPDLTGHGIGKQLLDELHSRLDPGNSYILLVLADNTGARRFYAREGFDEVAPVDAKRFYSEHMGVRFPPSASEIPCVVLGRTVEA